MKPPTLLILASVAASSTDAFLIHPCTSPASSSSISSSSSSRTILHARGGGLASRKYTTNNNGRNNNNRSGNDRSKRQERVGTMVQTELSKIIHRGVIKGHKVEYLDDDLRQRISVISADVSPDLKQARISVSVRAPHHHSINSIKEQQKEEDGEEEDWMEDDDDYDDDDDDYYMMEDGSGNSNDNDATVDSRRAYAWLVRNTKPLRHTLAQRMSHMKSCPDLFFVQVDVGVATDVMYLIDKVAAGYKRERIGAYNENDMPITGIVRGMDFDEDFDNEDDWEDDDDDFFSNTKKTK